MSNGATFRVTGKEFNATSPEIKEVGEETPQHLTEWTFDDLF